MYYYRGLLGDTFQLNTHLPARARPETRVLNRLIFGFFLLFSNLAVADAPLTAEAFARLPDVSNVTISPDGTKVVSSVRYQQGDERGVVLLLVDLISGKKATLMKSDNSKYVIGWFKWANNDVLLVSTHYPSRIYGTPVPATRLLRIDVNSKDIKPAVPKRRMRMAKYIPIVQDNVIDFMPNNPDEFLLSMSLSDEVGSEVLLVNHKSGKTKRVHRMRDWTIDWMTDRQNRLRIATYFKNTTTRHDYRHTEADSWLTLFEYQLFDSSSKSPLGFDADPDILYYSALNEGRDAIFKVNVKERPLQPELVYSHPRYDVDGTLIYSQKNDRVVGIRHSLGEGYIFWDEEYKRLQQSLNKALPKTNNKIIDLSRDERRIIVLSSSDTDAGTYYLWNRGEKTVTPLAYRYKMLAPGLMAEKQHITYSARDGLTISGYLTRPKDAAQAPGPTIIFPHGGPISYDGKGFDYWTQFFASRGYTVLQMNFRGSSGYGYDFMASGMQDWGGKMQTDVEDGTRWLIAEKIADPKRICVVGASYGGYAALMEAANNPDLYQCVVSVAGVTDLKQLVRKYRKFVGYAAIKEYIGSDSKDLKARSPVNLAKQIDVPTLIAHGSKDLRVPIVQGRRMHKKLKKAGKEVSYIEFEDGNHFLSKEEHRVQLFNEMDAFLNQHLGSGSTL